MASFTDQIAQFNPYVQQLPVDAMVQVGMEKQRRYDEGLQRIQSHIDKVAGMDIIRDVDKQYLQSKLNTLGGDLKKVAAGDFSNYQLVNSVGGMVSSLTKDKNVVNAAKSTAWYRQQVEKMQKDIDEGKSNPANLYAFNKGAQAWLNSANPGESFNGSYSPYFDVDKFVKETFDAVKPDGYTFEQLYETDEDGTPLIDSKTGKKILSTTMAKLKQEGRFPAKVEATLDQIFADGRVQQQLAINGEYSYRGFDSNSLKGILSESKGRELAAYEDAIGEINLRKAAGDKDPELDVKLDKLKTNKLRVENKFDDLLQASDSSPDYVRGLLYKDSVRNNYKAMYTNIEEERTYAENPAFNAQFKMSQEANRMAIHRDDLKYKYSALAQDAEQFQAKLDFDIKKELKDSESVDGYTRTFMNTGDVDLNTRFDKGVEEVAKNYDSALNDLLFNTVFKNEEGISRMQAANPEMTREQAMENIIKNTAAQNGESVSQFKARWALKAKDFINKTKADAEPIIQNKLSSLERSEKILTQVLDNKKKIDAQAPDIERNLITNLKPIMFNGVAFSEQDQYDIALVKGASMFADKTLKERAKKAKGRLDAKGLKAGDIQRVWEAAMAGGIGHTPTGAEPNSERSVDFYNTEEGQAFRNLIQGVASPDFNKAISRRAAAIKNFYEFNPVLATDVVSPETKVTEYRYSKIAGLIGAYNQPGQNVSPDFTDNAGVMSEIANDPKKGTIKFVATKDEITGEQIAKFVFYDIAANPVGEMTVTPDEAKHVGFDTENLFVSDEVRFAKERLNATGNYTTNTGGIDKIKDTYTYRTNNIVLDKSEMPLLRGLKGIQVKANVAANGPNGPYYAYIYVNNSKGVEFVTALKESKPSMDEALQLIKGIDSNVINSMIAEKTKP